MSNHETADSVNSIRTRGPERPDQCRAAETPSRPLTIPRQRIDSAIHAIENAEELCRAAQLRGIAERLHALQVEALNERERV